MVLHTITAGTQEVFPGTSLVVQWLEIHAPKRKGLKFNPQWGNKTSHATTKRPCRSQLRPGAAK